MNFDSIIVGAGISGLVAAYRLKKLGRDVLLIENSGRVGGAIQSREADGFLIEQGPNSLRGAHELLDLVEELDLVDELVTADPRAPAFVFSGGQLHAAPMGPGSLIKTKLISGSAKLRLLSEPFIKARSGNGEESIASFISRRLGNEVLEKLVAPFLSGVYAGEPERLSVQACFPNLAEFEAEAGSILRGGLKSFRSARKQPQPPKRSLRPYRLCSFRNGLITLPRRLARELGDSLLLEARIQGIGKSPEGFELSIDHRNENRQLSCSTLIIATPAYAAARLLEPIAPVVSGLLADIPYASLASVPMAYRADQLGRPADGFGFLAPRGEGLRTLGSIWNSSLFPGRVPDGWVMTTNFIGGATDPEAAELSDDELVSTVHNDLAKVLGITGEPRQLPITRYERAIPQYEIGHAVRVAKLEADLHHHRGLRLAGNYLHGVAIGDCIRQAELLATEIANERKSV